MMSAMHRLPAVAAAVLVALTLAACTGGGNVPYDNVGVGGSPPTTHPAAVVSVHYISFEPGRITIHVGQTVEWRWLDAPIDHDVWFGPFHSPLQATGTWYHTFTTPGTYPYRCTVHHNMVGTVVVVS
jgi:plastocyanin